jgi:hypothetical protein
MIREALGLAVGARRVGPGAQVAEPGIGAGAAEVVRTVGRAVVGHDPLDGDAVAAEPAERPVEEGDGAGLALVGENLAVGEPCGIVDRDVQDFPAAMAAGPGAIAGDAVADAVDPAELLGVDVEQLAGAGALVADHGRPGLERGEAAEAEAAQRQADGRTGPLQPARDLRPGQALAAQPLDRGGDLGRQPAGRSGGRRAAVMEGRLAARPMPRQPLVRGAHRHAGGARGGLDPPALLANSPDQKESTVDRHARILVDVHPRLLGKLFRSGNHSFNPSPRMNNLHSSHT